MKALVSIFVFVIFAGQALAVELDSVQRDRANALFKQVRCPVCTAQPVGESDAALSYALRAHIEEAIVDGKTDAQILNDLTRTYGDDIRLLPKTEARTLPLWFAPWLVIGIGVLGILIMQRRKALK